jgi:acyl-CoA synthetase (AMP-forming)/AMP-acid ligase II
VADVACIGIPHPEMGEQLLALVVPVDLADPPAGPELIDYCRARLAHVKCPRRIEIVDSLGRTPMGKVNKRELRRPYWPTRSTGRHLPKR